MAGRAAKPPQSAVSAFGGSWPPQRLPGGQGGAWRAGQIVLKPALPIDELEWHSAVLRRVAATARVRVAPPLRSAGGHLVVAGWSATPFLAGGLARGEWSRVIEAGDLLHAALAGEPRPPFLDRRTDPWAVADRVAWGEEQLHDVRPPRGLERVLAARGTVHVAAQLIHGDLSGNVLIGDGQPPAIIDLSPYWRPAAFASAIVVIDALVWHDADLSLVGRFGHGPQWYACLLRALAFRWVTALLPGRSRRLSDTPRFGEVAASLLAIGARG